MIKKFSDFFSNKYKTFAIAVQKFHILLIMLRMKIVKPSF